MKSTNGILITLLCSALIFSGCSSLNNTWKGAGIGTAAGAVLGAGVGKLLGNTAAGAIAGAAVGGTTGTLIGRKMDKQAEELETNVGNNAKVERVGEGIKVTFDSGILFKTGKYDLNSASKRALAKFAETLKKYPDTDIKIYGHTDNTGSDQLNADLSENRAKAVKSFLIAKGVASNRMETIGMGPSQPVASNDTAEGRQQNRRVEITITANEEMVQKAEAGTL